MAMHGLLWFTGDTCVSPVVDSKVYSTTEAQMSTESVVIVEFELACKNKPKVR